MSIKTIYTYVEGILLAVLTIQLITHAIKYRAPFIKDLEIQLFIIVCILNFLGFLFLDSENNTLYFFYHATAPTVLILGILLAQLTSPHIVILTSIVASAVCLGFTEYYYIALYNIAIFLVIRKGLNLINKRNSELQKALIYLVLSFDLFAAMIILVLKLTDFNWHASELIPYLHIARLIVFTTTLIVLNVKFRRFFTA